MKLTKKMAISAALFVACTAGTAFAAPVTLDFAGVGQPVAAMDWYPGNALAVGSSPLSTSPAAPTAFTLYYQAALNSFNNSGGRSIGGTGLGSTYEITTLIAFGETGFTSAVSGAANANFSLDLANPTNYVRMYKDSVQNSSDLAGTGFNDGSLFLSGSVVALINSSFSTTGQVQILDQFLADDWAGQLSVTGTGATSVVIKVDSFDSSVITGSGGVPIDLTYLIFNLDFNTSNNLPFAETDPSRLFYDVAAGANIVPNLGTVNGGNVGAPNGTFDVIFQADGNNSFDLATIPEPSTFALTGLGLLMAGGLLRRRAKK